MGLHILLAQNTGNPELAMSPEEGTQFLSAAQNVMRHYSVQSTQKTLDWIAFAGVSFGIYAPRLVAMRVRKSEEKRQRQPAATVHQFHRGTAEQGPGFTVVEPEFPDAAE